MLHTDAIQSFGKLPMSVPSGASRTAGAPGAYADFAGVDFISFSAHKIYGPKGVGALYAARPEKLAPAIRGGGQESGRRSGTENMPGIAGFGAAAQDVMEGAGVEYPSCASEDGERVALLRERLLQGIKDSMKDVRINSPEAASASGEPGCCSPYILNVSFLGTRGEVIVHDLEQHGVFVSTGSACSNIGKAGKGGGANFGPVPSAIGLTPKEAEGTVRFGLSRTNTEDEIDYALEQLSGAVGRYRRIGAYR
jgi:cysteine desulfurase